MEPHWMSQESNPGDKSATFDSSNKKYVFVLSCFPCATNKTKKEEKQAWPLLAKSLSPMTFCFCTARRKLGNFREIGECDWVTKTQYPRSIFMATKAFAHQGYFVVTSRTTTELRSPSPDTLATWATSRPRTPGWPGSGSRIRRSRCKREPRTGSWGWLSSSTKVWSNLSIVAFIRS